MTTLVERSRTGWGAGCLTALLLAGCFGRDGTSAPPSATSALAGGSASALPAACPAEQPAPALLPGIRPVERTLGYWLDRVSHEVDLDEAVLSADDIADHNAGLASVPALTPQKPAGSSAGRALTRRALLEEAFRHLDAPCRAADQPGQGDCARFLVDVFAAFGLLLPRDSSLQAQAGSFRVPVAPLASRSERLAVIDAAARRGIVVLHWPGDSALYLGRSAEGRPMVIHALGEYRTPCAAGAAAGAVAETLVHVDRVQVSDLELGQGGSSKSFLDRITDVAVLGRSPGAALAGAAEHRPAAPLREPFPAKCQDSDEVAMFVSPRRPNATAPVRVVVTSSRDLGAARLVLVGPDGATAEPTLHALGGPPFGYWTELSAPATGRWLARIGEGNQIAACTQFSVSSSAAGRQAGSGPVWEPSRKWSQATENLFATFVAQLFDYPPGEDQTWPNLQALLASRDKNILFNHLGQNEDELLALKPDCADMPYFLRAYFAWKMRLPFGYRHCNRGKDDRAPYCDRDILSSLDDRQVPDEVGAFAAFARHALSDGVQSGNGRTAPRDEQSDFYPVPLSREALRPGTLFADPYGHVLIIAGWVAQGVGSYGMLLGAESQPDGTIGRRRFWRGSFLFTPDTSTVGAGFKAFRPLVYRKGSLRAIKNADLAQLGFTPFSEQQYQGSLDDFYKEAAPIL